MICKKPIIITRPNQGNGGLYQKVSVPCGSCGQCLSTKRNEWTFRLKEEIKYHSSSHFITLTYADEYIRKTPRGLSTLDKRDLQTFIKRLRSYQSRKLKIFDSIRYYAVGEYGERTSRPHYHLITFSTHPKVIEKISYIWSQGQVQIGKAESASIHYVTKYFINKQIPINGDRVLPFSLMSKGIGKGYLKRAKNYHQKTQNNYVVQDGNKTRMPRYYKDKIFTTHEKQIFYESAMRQQNKKITDKLIAYDHYENPSQYFAEQKEATHKAIIKKSKNSKL